MLKLTFHEELCSKVTTYWDADRITGLQFSGDRCYCKDARMEIMPGDWVHPQILGDFTTDLTVDWTHYGKTTSYHYKSYEGCPTIAGANFDMEFT